MGADGVITVEVLTADDERSVRLLAELRWREWGRPPEPTELSWWVDVTRREAGDGGSTLPVTFVARDGSRVVGGVGLAKFDTEDRRDRSPWVVGTAVTPAARGQGVGSRLMAMLERWAADSAIEEAWVSTGSGAGRFYESCGWTEVERLPPAEAGVRVVLTKHLLWGVSVGVTS